MKKNALYIVYAAVIAAQLFVPGRMVCSSEDILVTGARYRFVTVPVDPVDAFRGKYINLNFSAASCTMDTAEKIKDGAKAYAVLARDLTGYATVTGLVSHKPEQGDFIRVKVIWARGGKAQVRFPFEKFFLDENMAAGAEKLYREHNIRGRQDAYAVVRVKNGRAVIEDMIIGGLPVREAVKKAAAK
jgi:uncharacterized membrane-anchored protein